MTNPDGLWWTVALLTGAGGAAFLIYGIRQRHAISLAFGLLYSIVCMFTDSGVTALALTTLLGVAHYALLTFL